MNLLDGCYLELLMKKSTEIWFKYGKRQDAIFPHREEGFLSLPQEKWESSN